MTYSGYFQQLTGHPEPRIWQSQLAALAECRDRLIRIPTGLGKTEGVLSSWCFHRIQMRNELWPRRLIWCLPMRTLVEQTAQVAQQLVSKISAEDRPLVHVVMGGQSSSDWYLYPEKPAIIIGTQDMLLSRALNRGYAAARARWPLEFGLLHQDALWVMDEVQLMDVGLATSAQLQAFRSEDQAKALKPCYTWWMSATLQSEWLHSIDTEAFYSDWKTDPVEISKIDRKEQLWTITKSLHTEKIDATRDKDFARLILDEHGQLSEDGHGRITLVICNTVDRACQTYDALEKAGRKTGLELVHSRFRPCERKEWSERFLSRAACSPGVDRIIVATQVVEAGVDISAGCLITELAPWSSMVQRFGRCARYAGPGKVVVVDRGREPAKIAPYQSDELESAWEALSQILSGGVGLSALEDYEAALSQASLKELYPYCPSQLLLRSEFDELFDTTPDLSGADLDISRFIRSNEAERDLQVFWLEVPKEHSPKEDVKPRREELCTVPFLRVREWLCENKSSKLKSSKRAWIWDWLDGRWAPAIREQILPGRIVCVATDCGGYLPRKGFDATSNATVVTVALTFTDKIDVNNAADDQQDGDQVSHFQWKTIAGHTAEVVDEVKTITEYLSLAPALQSILLLAASFHDWGKSHPAFQGSIRDAQDGSMPRLPGVDLAKAPDKCWPRKHLYQYLDNRDTRPGFRHELASALGLFSLLSLYAPQHAALLGPWMELPKINISDSGVTRSESQLNPLIQQLLRCSAEEFNLLAYLTASHHGKVRVALHSAPKDQDYIDRDNRGLPVRGVRTGDVLPEVVLIPGQSPMPSVELSLEPATLGVSRTTGISWRERCLELQSKFGPGSLAFLEAILCAADRRASRLTTADPILTAEIRS